MKGVIATISTIIYAVFITGSAWVAQDVANTAFSESGKVYTLSEHSQEPAKISFGKDLNAMHFGKVIKHLVGGGKNKVPRIGYTPAVFTNFVSDLNPHHSSLITAVEKPALYPHSIFLKNRVLRI